MRYQQVFAASQFSALNPLGGFITDIFFKLDGTFGSRFETTLPNVQINFSTTLRAPDALMPTFADNVGVDDTVVFGAGPLPLRGDGTSFSLGPRIALTTPFFYNPALGNLLLDVRNFSGVPTTDFDATGDMNDSVSRVYANSVSSPTADRVDSIGLITGFQAEPIPEPASVMLSLLGGATLACLAWSNRRRQWLYGKRRRTRDETNPHESERRLNHGTHG
jgi:hypothetical protein